MTSQVSASSLHMATQAATVSVPKLFTEAVMIILDTP